MKSSTTQSNWSLAAAFGAGVFASACCVIPVALVSLGLGGAWLGILTVLEPYRWLFAALALGALGYAVYNEWQMSHHPRCDCESTLTPLVRRSLLGAGALATLALIASPWLIPTPNASISSEAPAAAVAASASATPTSYQQVVLHVEGMTCAGCAVTVRETLESVPGVYSAEVTYEPPQAVVRFDPSETSTAALTEATVRAGYPARPPSPL